MTNEQFKTWRQKMGLTQKQAADALGISLQALGNYERGYRYEDERSVKIPLVVDLACAAIAAGLMPYSKQEG